MKSRLGYFRPIVLLVACGPVDAPPASVAPFNSCSMAPCSAYEQAAPEPVCTEGVCVASGTFDYTVVVSLPETSFFAPNHTFAIPSSKLFANATLKTCPALTCAALPALGRVSGDYLVAPQEALIAERCLLEGCATQTSFISLPVHVAFRPLWTMRSAIVEAESAGIPLSSIAARAIVPTGGDPGPGGTPTTSAASIGFDTALPVGDYERTILPDPPFDSSFPPDILGITVTGITPFDQVKLAIDNPQPAFQISAASGSLKGWTAALYSVTTHRRVSSVATLDAGPTQVVLNTFQQVIRNVELQVNPPAGANAAPTMAIPEVAGVIPPDETYPALPAPVAVSGVITASLNSSVVTAQLFFQSSDLETANADPKLKFSTILRYSARVSTDAAGHYALALPPGHYDVAVLPAPASPYAQWGQKLTISDSPTTLENLDFRLVSCAKLTGFVKAADNRLLGGAEVEARPTAEPPTAGGPFVNAIRAASTQTDATGFFALPVDPGTYDITVRPAEGTRFPWLIATGKTIGSTDRALETLVVPAPISAGLTLHDPNDNPVVRALVRIYAVPSGKTLALEVGRALTDTSGHYEMYLSGPPQ